MRPPLPSSSIGSPSCLNSAYNSVLGFPLAHIPGLKIIEITLHFSMVSALVSSIVSLSEIVQTCCELSYAVLNCLGFYDTCATLCVTDLKVS